MLLSSDTFVHSTFCQKGVLRNFAKFTGKHLCQSLFLNKVAGLRKFNKAAVAVAVLLKKRLWHRCFPVNFAKFLRTLFLKNISGRLPKGEVLEMNLSSINFDVQLFLCQLSWMHCPWFIGVYHSGIYYQSRKIENS